MAIVKHIGSLTEVQILALNSTSELWFEFGLYFPSDSNGGNYFYRLENGIMVKKGGGGAGSGIGITLNNLVIGGVKSLIEATDVLYIPENYEYNAVKLDVDGIVNLYGEINLI